ncbi:uncharacterized protein LOC108733699 isoform X2 [Agrilus planipennis]|uniref:Uncharacterized protein LOC108733699 isoform X2 n=1 Tax=Agrilus planipennis TaxID=224129 RepID=A0A1W4WK30_AGRPL|nr:uncharacterized protein LOC108733699 isoform X2 [Agrilus planipennis]
MIKSVFIPLFFVTFVVIIARGEPHENDSPQPRFDSFSKENVFPWIKPNATRGTDNLEDGSNGNLEVFGRTFFNWFKDGDKQSDPTDFLRPFIRHTLSAILSPIIYPLQRILKCFKNAFMVIKNVICNCSNSIPA